jgi:membrane-associated protease RseP (regulator of RpoE activity)
MKLRYVFLVAAMLIAGAVVSALLTGKEEAERRIPDTHSSQEHQPPLTPRDGRGALQTSESQLTEEDGPRASAKSATMTAAAPRREVRVGKRKNEPPGRQFNERVLEDLGYSPRTIQFIRALWERSNADEAARAQRSDPYEWTPDDPRNTEIRDGLRSDLGEDLYDAMLYATNQSNRVQLGNVIETSPAAAAGLRIKDVIVSYDGERIFDPGDAKRLTEGSEPGRIIEVWIQRDGEVSQRVLEGGPLGVRYFPDWKAPTRD